MGMWLDEYNIAFSEIGDRLKSFGFPPDTPCVLRVVFMKTDVDWQFFLGCCHLNAEESMGEGIDAFHHYRFITAHTTFSNLMHAINHPGTDIPLLDSGLAISFTERHWSSRLISSHQSAPGKPVREFTTQVSESNHLHTEPLMRYGWGMMNPEDYIRDFLPLPDFHGTNDARRGELKVCIIEQRGHISFTDERIEIAEPVGEVNLVGYINRELRISLMANDSYTLPSQVNSLELCLIDRDEHVLDYVSNFFVDTLDLSEQSLLELINAGEGTRVEFKKFVDVKTVDEKIKETLKAICAFSNTQGGVVIIGVQDDGLVIGVEKKLRSTYKTSLESARQLYCAGLKAQIQNNLQYADCATISIKQVFGETVVVISVSMITGTNTTLNPEIAYERRSATNKVLSHLEIANRSSSMQELF